MSLSSYRSEASFAKSHRKWGGCSSKQVKLLRKASKDYNRAVRRNKRNAIAYDIAAEQRCPIPTIGKAYHDAGSDWFDDDVGCWSVAEGRYVMLRHDIDHDRLELLCQPFEWNAFDLF